MKKIIFTITLLFSHASFGLDALDGKSIICTYEHEDPIHYGFRFVGHNVVGDVFKTRNDVVTIEVDYGGADFSETRSCRSYFG